MRKFVLIGLIPVLTACGYSGSVNLGATPPQACVPFNATAAATLPAGVTGTVTTAGGWPATLTWTPATLTLAGTPIWADVGNHTLTGNGTVTSAVTFFRKKSWSGSTTMTILPPPVTTPLPTLLIPAFGGTSPPITLEVIPVAPIACGPFTATYPNNLPGLAQVSITPRSPQASTSNAITLEATGESAANYNGFLPVTLTPTAPAAGPSFTVNIPVRTQ